MKPLKLFSTKPDQTSHGGATRKGKRKVARHFEPRKLVHVVMRSSKARGDLNFRKGTNPQLISKILKEQAQKNHVVIHEMVNVGNHLHIKARPYTRVGFSNFLKLSASLIARKVTGAKKGKAFGKFWDALCFTRILKTSREEFVLKKYFYGNELEVEFGKEVRQIFLYGWAG